VSNNGGIAGLGYRDFDAITCADLTSFTVSSSYQRDGTIDASQLQRGYVVAQDTWRGDYAKIEILGNSGGQLTFRWVLYQFPCRP